MKFWNKVDAAAHNANDDIQMVYKKKAWAQKKAAKLGPKYGVECENGKYWVVYNG